MNITPIDTASNSRFVSVPGILELKLTTHSPVSRMDRKNSAELWFLVLLGIEGLKVPGIKSIMK